MIRHAATDMKTVFKAILLLALLASMASVAQADPPFQLTPQGARYKDLQPGTGDSAEPGDVATIHFTGWLDDNGKEGRQIYNTRKEHRPISFVIGTDRVMPGWNEGVIGMRQGGKRLVMLPPALGYGGRGAQDAVPPGSSLIFVIDLVELEKR